ncbi:DUF4382 domain-containing protein [Hymenobacter taeanensis]|uniref:DUF4382 domain-containing protein n=1 Tax=Hymenobacter taeanensis TaxID=2735321 RepID=A0A6M6BFI7_9BACT|nr:MULTISPECIES: DUF4382 domain-containing protein [Hymenobacter]QJX46712.1 DUF4382 domain-containing protein [Hymenobacter taeanensis]UOQ80578.1 DUF4382 domain-containing protein [Hymenobacter sp. 5414T-23]
MKLSHLLPLATLALPLALTSCSKDNDSAGSSKLEVRLMDAPGDYQSVVLDVQQIEVHLKDEAIADGWQLLPFKAQAINVLDYVNGKSALLVNTDFAPGDLKEIRLLLGPDSYVIGRDGQRYDLKTPSGQSSGVKLKLDKATLRERETFQLLLDFDVAKSIVERGNWKPGNERKERYVLKPVVRVVAQAVKGGLRGTVTPAAALPHVLAIRSSITVPDTFSTAADASGAFQLSSLPSGTYKVQFFPSATAPTNQPAYKAVTRTGIIVTNDQVTDLGQTSLN